MLPANAPITKSLIFIARNEGIASLFAGVGPRILWSALFGGIGLSCFEECKKLLQIVEPTSGVVANPSETKEASPDFHKKSYQLLTPNRKV